MMRCKRIRTTSFAERFLQSVMTIRVLSCCKNDEINGRSDLKKPSMTTS
jgi:hypothetical protein